MHAASHPENPVSPVHDQRDIGILLYERFMRLGRRIPTGVGGP